MKVSVKTNGFESRTNINFQRKRGAKEKKLDDIYLSILVGIQGRRSPERRTFWLKNLLQWYNISQHPFSVLCLEQLCQTSQYDRQPS